MFQHKSSCEIPASSNEACNCLSRVTPRSSWTQGLTLLSSLPSSNSLQTPQMESFFMPENIIEFFPPKFAKLLEPLNTSDFWHLPTLSPLCTDTPHSVRASAAWVCVISTHFWVPSPPSSRAWSWRWSLVCPWKDTLFSKPSRRDSDP